MTEGHASPGPSAVMALTSAFLWATYFFFVLAMTPGTSASAVATYPFLIGGAMYVAWAAYWGHGRVVLHLFGERSAWGRVGLISAMQLSVLACTYLAGAVDTSLLALLGDAAMTPLLAMVVLKEGRHRARSLPFVGGLILAGFGATLTIVAGGSATGFHGWSLVIAPLVPLSVGGFYILSAQAGQHRPSSAVVGQSTLAGGFVCLLLAGVLPGGWHGLVLTAPIPIVLMVGVAATSFFIAPALYFRAVARSGIVLPALFQVMIPIFALLLSAVLLHKVPAPLGLLGLPIAVIGGFFAYRGAQAPAPPVPHEAALLTEGGALAPDAPGDPSETGVRDVNQIL
ncbi:MAG: DMT family transporter [Thermoplasmata archaeon]